MLDHMWLGRAAMHLDAPGITACGDILLGCYGGNRRAGAVKNEDGAFVMCADDASWHFAALCDAHATSESAELVLSTLVGVKSAIRHMLAQPAQIALPTLHTFIIDLLGTDEFLARCRAVQGETACLVCVQKAQWLWWLSIGDCALYLFHPELAQLGQFALNQRNFYEWIGQVNSLALSLPCYSTGVRELRQGRNDVVLVTDGLLEFGTRPFDNPQRLYALFAEHADAQACVAQALALVHAEGGRDSATMIHWRYDNPVPGVRPTG